MLIEVRELLCGERSRGVREFMPVGVASPNELSSAKLAPAPPTALYNMCAASGSPMADDKANDSSNHAALK
jgi:hypothetical protein